MSKNNYYEMPDLATPKEGATVMLNRWWATLNGNPVGCRIRGSNYPQCNADEETAKRIAEKLGLESPMFVAVAFFVEE